MSERRKYCPCCKKDLPEAEYRKKTKGPGLAWECIRCEQAKIEAYQAAEKRKNEPGL